MKETKNGGGDKKRVREGQHHREPIIWRRQGEKAVVKLTI